MVKQRKVEVREENGEYEDDDIITEANGEANSEDENANDSGDEEGHEHNRPSLAEKRSLRVSPALCRTGDR